MNTEKKNTAYYHLPGLFEFYELYRLFLPLFREHREYFYDWCDIGSVYGAPSDCLWGGGRVGFGDNRPEEVLALMREYGISARLTFSNSLLQKEHLSDKKCNELCIMFGESREPANGVIVHSDLLADYLQEHYPGLYLVSSTTKVLTDFSELTEELNRKEFRYVVPDFRLNKAFDKWGYPFEKAKRQGGISLQRMLLFRMQRQKKLLRSGQPQKPRRRCRTLLQRTGCRRRVSFLQSHGKSGLYRHRGYYKRLSAHGLFTV